jgi:hypothetical protein
MDAMGSVVLGQRPAPPRRLPMTQLREFQHEQWRLRALVDYAALLTRLIQRSPEDGDLYDRIERAIAEAHRTQARLDEMADALDTANCEKRNA